MLQPKKTKHRKSHKGRVRGVALKGCSVSFGEYGLKSLGTGRITAVQIEAARVALTRHIKRKGKVWIRVFPYKPVTKKPAETRMGKGKGDISCWVAPVRPGAVLFEVDGVSETMAKEALRRAANKLPFRTMFVTRR